MIHHNSFRLSPYDAQVIHHDHFSAYAIHAGSDETENIKSIHISHLELDFYNFPSELQSLYL